MKKPTRFKLCVYGSSRLLEHVFRAAVGCLWHHFPHSTAALGARGFVLSPAAPRAQLEHRVNLSLYFMVSASPAPCSNGILTSFKGPD